MVAVNPVNYGKAYKLSCAESVAATLFLAGFYKEADNILSRFKWGKSFFDVNRELFDNYKHCSNSEELKKFESEYIQAEMESRKNRKEHNDIDVSLENSSEEEAEQIDFNQIDIQSITDGLTKKDKNK
jgi:pre-rRNA-processing protein TSR3